MKLLIAAMLLLSGTALATADPLVVIVPDSVHYQAMAGADGETQSCQLLLDSADLADSEVTRAAALVAVRGEGLMVALRFQVLDLAVNADDLTATPAELASAGFSSPTFNTAGLYQQIDEDAAAWTWIEDAVSSKQFLDAFVSGGFQLIFTRADKDLPVRRYQIDGAPPAEVTAQFMDCMKALLPAATAARPAPASRHGEAPRFPGQPQPAVANEASRRP